MKVGIGLPTMIPGMDGPRILEWARHADRSPLSSLSAGEHLAHDCHDAMTALAVVAAATERVRLITSVLALPVHNAGLLAKQAASLDVLSGGRLSLGVGLSSRPQDFQAAPAPWEHRGRRFEEQIELMRRIWRGEAPVPGAPPVGPPPVQPGGPELLVGAFRDQALRRAGRLADGLLSWSFAPDPGFHQRCYRIVEEEWRRARRSGRPRFLAAIYFALGPEAGDRLHRFLSHYYGYVDDEVREPFLRGITTTTPGAVRDTIKGYADAGIDELIFSPTIGSIDQVDRLADLVP